MRIMMLGHSGVGKTTYMACMYAKMFEGEGDFSIVASSEADHDRFLQLALSVVNEGVYPAGTDLRAEYNLQLLHRRRAVLPFTWVDYRGVALEEDSRSPGAAQLQKDLRGADAILAFFDTTALAHGGTRRNPQVGRLVALLTEAVAEVPHVLPIGLILTKFDELEEARHEAAVQPLTGLIHAIQASRTLHGALVPTACGHRRLVNVSLPAIFVLHVGIAGRLLRLRQQIEARIERAQNYRGRSGLLDWLDSRLSGLPTYGEMADDEIAAAHAEAASHDELVEPAKALAPLLDGMTRF